MKTGMVAVIPAAGEGSRMGGCAKALLRHPAQPQGPSLLERIAHIAARLNIASVVVVGGSFAKEVAEHAGACGFHVVHNPHAQLADMASSIRAALQHPLLETAAGLLLWPADAALVREATVANVIESASRDRIVIPCYEGRGGHPTAFGAEFFRSLVQSAETREGARAVIRGAQDAVRRLDVADARAILDIDGTTDWPPLAELG